MIKAHELIVAMLVIDDADIFVVGRISDIQRLADAGLVERAWDIKLDNGHRPYPSLKKRMDHEITDIADNAAGTALTRELTVKTGISFSYDIHLLTDTYLFRPTPAFWADLWADFADGPGLPSGRKIEDYYAVYRGYILPNVSNVKFVRL